MIMVAVFAAVACSAVVLAAAALTSGVPKPKGSNEWPTMATSPQPPVALFIGDSYTSGSGASSTAKRWTTLVAASQGWRESNLALGGTGYLTSASAAQCGKPSCPDYRGVIAEAAQVDAAVVVVSGGASDRNQSIAAERDAISTFYRTVRESFPTAKVIAVGPIAPKARIGASVVQMDEDVRSAAAAIGALYVDMLDPVVLSAKMVASDHANANDAGHAAIAARVEAALK